MELSKPQRAMLRDYAAGGGVVRYTVTPRKWREFGKFIVAGYMRINRMKDGELIAVVTEKGLLASQRRLPGSGPKPSRSYRLKAKPSPTLHPLCAEVLRAIKASGRSIADVCRSAGVNETTTHAWFAEYRVPNVGTVIKVLDALGKKIIVVDKEKPLDVRNEVGQKDVVERKHEHEGLNT